MEPMFPYDYMEKQMPIQNVSPSHKIFIYDNAIILMNYNKEKDTWYSKVYEHMFSERTKGENSIYRNVALVIRNMDESGFQCPNYVTEITKSDFKIKELGIEY